MAIHLKRIVFFFCILNFGLGCCFGNRANAQDPEIIYRLFLSSVFYQHDPMKIIGRVFLLTDYTIGLPDVVIYSAEPWWDLGPDTKYVPVAVTDGKGDFIFTSDDRTYTLIPRKNGYQFTPEGVTGKADKFWPLPLFAAYWLREISGRVTHSDGSGFANVGIYHNTIQMAVTDIQGYYKAILPPYEYTLIPQASGYLFTPPSRSIPADQSNHGNQNFTAQTALSISGNVIWKNHFNTTIPSNPLPLVAMEAWAEDGSLSSRSVTDANGNYSLSVPGGWTGWVKPVLAGFEFWPEKIDYNTLNENKIQDYYAPSYWGQTIPPTGHVYKITVSVKRPGGALLPPSEKFIIWFNGINHANGSKVYCQIVTVPINLGECSLSQPSGWIGDIVPTNFEGGFNYTFAPASYHMNEILTSDLTFGFEATE